MDDTYIITVFVVFAELCQTLLPTPKYHSKMVPAEIMTVAVVAARYFGITELLNPRTAREIYMECNRKLNTPAFSTRNLLRRMNVKVICTTNDPTEDLSHHIRIRKSGFEIKVLPTFRPDRALWVHDALAPRVGSCWLITSVWAGGSRGV